MFPLKNLARKGLIKQVYASCHHTIDVHDIDKI